MKMQEETTQTSSTTTIQQLEPAPRPVNRPVEPRPQSSTSENPPVKKATGARAKVFGVIFFSFMILAVGGLVWWMYAQGHEETDDSYIDGHINLVSSRVSGNVAKVLVNDNQLVKANQLLVTLDPSDYQVEVDQIRSSLAESEHQAAAAKAKIGQSSLSAQGQSAQASGDVSSGEADLDMAKAGRLQALAAVQRAKAKVTEMRAGVQYAKSDFERYETAWANKAVTKQQFDRAKQNIEVSEAQLNEGQEALREAEKQVAQADANIAQARGKMAHSQGTVTTAAAAGQQQLIDKEQFEGSQSEVARQKSQLAKALLNRSYCELRASVDGRVGKKSVEIGQRIEPGQALMSIVQDNVWVTANFKETQLAKMKPGQKVEVRIDSFPAKVFTGHVDSFSPASGAKFSILPPDNASGNFTKVVQRIPVKMILDKESVDGYEGRLSPGMSCVTTVLFK